jgi:hypothetical protein
MGKPSCDEVLVTEKTKIVTKRSRNFLPIIFIAEFRSNI